MWHRPLLIPNSTPAVSLFHIHSLTQFNHMCGNWTLLMLGSGSQLVEIESQVSGNIADPLWCWLPGTAGNGSHAAADDAADDDAAANI